MQQGILCRWYPQTEISPLPARYPRYSLVWIGSEQQRNKKWWQEAGCGSGTAEMDAKWGHSLERIGIQDSILAIPGSLCFIQTKFPGNKFSQYVRSFVCAKIFMQWTTMSVVSKLVGQQHSPWNLLLIEMVLTMEFDQDEFADLWHVHEDMAWVFFFQIAIHWQILIMQTFWDRHSGAGERDGEVQRLSSKISQSVCDWWQCSKCGYKVPKRHRRGKPD